MESIKIHDKNFKLYLTAEKIEQAVDTLAERINKKFAGQEIVFLSILNGSFMFTADLMKKVNLPCRLSFVKVSSYNGMSSSGNMIELIGINEILDGKTVIVLEDIVDSGNTLSHIIDILKTHKPDSVKIASLLFKPDAFMHEYAVDYIGFEIPNRFVVGYGLDYDGLGRNLKEIYTVIDS